jgi:hypothetical protein
MSLRLNGQPLKVLTEDLEADIIGEYDVRTWSDIMCICGRWIQLSQQKPCLQRMLRYVDQIPNQTSCCSFHHAICKYERERERERVERAAAKIMNKKRAKMANL